MKDTMGELSATRLVLWSAVERFSTQQRLELRDVISGTLPDLQQLWGDDLSDFQRGNPDELTRLVFKLVHPPKPRVIDGNTPYTYKWLGVIAHSSNSPIP